MNKPFVTVLMSTYNGDKFISKQLDSILSQQDVKVRIVIRDDGSKDNTISIIKTYMMQYKDKISFHCGENVGFAMSFNWLIKNVGESEYYAFSDQDDFWYPDKLIHAISHLHGCTPILYSSNMYIKSEYNNVGYLLYDCETKWSEIFKHYYFFNPFGCTMVWNNALHINMQVIENTYKITHDTLANIVANITGQLYYDEHAYIDHIIHTKNAGGITPENISGKIKKYWKFYFTENKTLQKKDCCKLIAENYNVDIPLLNDILNYGKFSSKIKIYKKLKIIDIPKQEKIKFFLLMLVNRF